MLKLLSHAISFRFRPRPLPLSALTAAVFCAPGMQAEAATVFVSSAADIEEALRTAQPGDELVMTNGVYTDQEIDFAGNGTASAPITLRAETPGAVRLNGTSNLSISGSHLVVDGLNFEGGGGSDLSSVVQFRGSLGNASDSRLTNTQIRNYNPPSQNTRYPWVVLYGQDNRVDHSQFQGQNHSGVTVVAFLEDGVEARHRIDSNAFLDRPQGNDNGFESIRIGDSATQQVAANVVVENNLFERVDGEIEIISNKSAGNTYRYNTFRDSAGTLTLRHGNAATVDGNFFLGEGRDGSGGIRVVGEDHVIVNNYIADVDDRADGAISLSSGIENTVANGYAQVRNVEISNNTIVNVNGPAVTFDEGFGELHESGGTRDVLAENVSFTNNLISSTEAELFEGREGSGFTYQTNIAHGADLGISAREGLSRVDPQLQQGADGLFRLSANSPAIDAGTALSSVTQDMDGQARIGLLDIGSDEFSTATIVRKPLTSDTVGPAFARETVDPPAGPFVALQAESYTRLTDPNGDGAVWETIEDATALDGFAIAAPDGSRTRIEDGAAHDTLALYDLSFAEAGEYTAYYRGRGFSSSSDSVFTPGDFGVDPDDAQSTSSTGAFAWITGKSFEIEESAVGVPLEFRLGKREGLTQLDAIVFHQDGDLTDRQLDALFATPVPEPGAAVVLLSLLPLTARRRRALLPHG